MQTITRQLAIVATTGTALLFSASAASAATAESAAYVCQRQVANQAVKYAAKRNKTVASCLDKIAKEIVLKGHADAGRAAKACVAKLRKLENSEAPHRTLAGKLEAKLAKACDPAINAKLALQTEDVLGGVGASVAEPLNAQLLHGWCANFGGDGVVDTVADWASCVRATADCQANLGLAVQYPRLLGFLDLIRPSIEELGDSAKVTDALQALDMINTAIEGDTDDDRPELSCGL